MQLQTLYKKNSNGSIQFWEISVDHSTIITRWGQLDGKIQETHDEITTGKNTGKKNETTPAKQAELEATSLWEKKLKKGYVKDITNAEQDKVDIIIEGGVFPMLAHRFDQHGEKLFYPCYVQPKLDGHRCIAVVENSKCTLWSRTRKLITGVPHIAKDVEEWAVDNNRPNIILDGELYGDDYKDKFEELSSFIRQETPKEGHEVVQYHIYDIVDKDLTFANRHAILSSSVVNGSLVLVHSPMASDEDDLFILFDNFIKLGYEGAIARNSNGLYSINKRSYDLLKIKEFMDAEFTIVNVEEGRGKMKGHAIFVCTAGDTLFNVKMKGSSENLRQYVENPKLAIGRQLTVQFQGYTKKNNVPRFPVALRLREDL